MKYGNYEFAGDVSAAFEETVRNSSLPHAVIIESADAEKSGELARLFSMYAVCSGENKPCGECGSCRRAYARAHADISFPKTKNKSKTYSIEQMRDIIADAYIKPNEGGAKAYIFENADQSLPPITQNAFLKVLEEPPGNVYFFLLCENARGLLSTIRSRCALVRLGGEREIPEVCAENAARIVNGMMSLREYDLLLSLRSLTEKEYAAGTLFCVSLILRDALVILSGGEACFEPVLAGKLAARFTRARLTAMLELTQDTQKQINQNFNINLLTTRLCGEYRRISWQR